VIRIIGVGGSHQRAGVDQQHSVASETLGQQLVGLSTTTSLARRANSDERQTSPRPARCDGLIGLIGLVERGGEGLRGERIDTDAAPNCFDRQAVG
jgi:hypothetical protein